MLSENFKKAVLKKRSAIIPAASGLMDPLKSEIAKTRPKGLLL